MCDEYKKRTDLIGKKGTITKSFTIVDAREYPMGVNVLVENSTGEEFWTSLDELELKK